MKRSLKILLVDDDRDLIDLFVTLLEMDGACVTTAANYHDALEIFEKESFDLVITDWRMPKMTGLILADMIKGTRPEVPVIIISAYLSPERIAEAKKKKVDMCLAKPFEYKDLHAGILKLVKK